MHPHAFAVPHELLSPEVLSKYDFSALNPGAVLGAALFPETAVNTAVAWPRTMLTAAPTDTVGLGARASRPLGSRGLQQTHNILLW